MFINKLPSIFLAHKFLVLIGSLILLLSVAGIGVRASFISNSKLAQNSISSTHFPYVSPTPESFDLAVENPQPSSSAVLGTSTAITVVKKSTPAPTKSPAPTSAPTPAPTYAPIVIYTPAPTSQPTSSPSSNPHSCAGMGKSPGEPTNWYSQARYSENVESSVIVSIELRDCNNRITSSRDTIDIIQLSGQPITVNGHAPTVSLTTSNGKTSFTVKSLVSGTVVLRLRDTTSNIDITDTKDRNPQITFTISPPAATPTPTPTPTTTPTATSTPSPSPSPSPAPSDSPSPTPSNSSTPQPSATP